MGIFAASMKQVIKDVKLEGLPGLAAELLPLMQDQPVWTFTGNLGAGKTTFIKALCEKLEVTGEVQSPTFSIVNTYQTLHGETLYHFDCYRLKHWHEAMDFGIEEYLYSGNICLIEWPQVIEQLLPEETVSVQIEVDENNLRQFIIEGINKWPKAH